MGQAERAGFMARFVALLVAAVTFLVVFVALVLLRQALGLQQFRYYWRVGGAVTLLASTSVFSAVMRLAGNRQAVLRAAAKARKAERAAAIAPEPPPVSADLPVPQPITLQQSQVVAPPAPQTVATLAAQPEVAQQLALVEQLPRLAGQLPHADLAQLALQGWGSPHATVREATYRRVRELASADPAWGSYLLGNAHRAAQYDPGFLTHAADPAYTRWFLGVVTTDASAYERWRLRGELPRAS